MRVIVCGGRNYQSWATVEQVLDWLHRERGPIECVVHGGATGADTLAATWASRNAVLELAYPADWDKHGKAAGPIRNRQMASAGAEYLVAFPGKRGTDDMIKQAKAKKITVIRVPKPFNGDLQIEEPA